MRPRTSGSTGRSSATCSPCCVRSIEHFTLVTGLNHYIGPFAVHATGSPSPTPFRKAVARLDIPSGLSRDASRTSPPGPSGVAGPGVV